MKGTSNQNVKAAFLTAAIALALSLSLGAFAHPKAAPAMDIVDTAVAAGSFKTLAAALQAAGRPTRPQAMPRRGWVAVVGVDGWALCWAAARGSPPGLMQLLGGEPTCFFGQLSAGAGEFGLAVPPPDRGAGGRHRRSG